jgi:hypothetical protein
MFNTSLLHDISMKTQTRRPLGGFERFFWLFDQQRAVHFAMVKSAAICNGMITYNNVFNSFNTLARSTTEKCL